MRGCVMILCHKDSGVLVRNGEPMAGLYYCQCISGWVRGFEPIVTREEALKIQAEAVKARIALYRAQGRSEAEISRILPKCSVDND